MITDEELQFLSTLAYNNAFDSDKATLEMGDELCQYVIDLRTDAKSPIHTPPTGYSPEQWERFLDRVQESPGLQGLTVRDITQNSVDGGSMITLVDPSTREAVIVLEGTCTPEGWGEDLRAMFMVMTDSEREAVGYAYSMASGLDGYTVLSTGHSKGGNEAVLLALECPFVSRGVGYDAPGRSLAYLNDPFHGARAEANAGKVTYIGNADDPISATMARVGDDERWLATDLDEWAGVPGWLEGVLSFSPHAHATHALGNEAMLDGTGGFMYADGPAPHNGEINALTLFLMDGLASGDLETLALFLGDAIGSARSGGGEVGADGEEPDGLYDIVISNPEAVGILLATLAEYPGTDALMGSVLDEEGIVRGALAALLKTSFRAGLEGPELWLTEQLVALLGLCGAVAWMYYNGDFLEVVARSYAAARLRMRAKSLVAEDGLPGGAALSSAEVRDFSDARLAEVRELVSRIADEPVTDLGLWDRDYAGERFWRRLDLAGEQGDVRRLARRVAEQAGEGADEVARRFGMAWDLDDSCAVRASGDAARVGEAAAMLAAR